ncbi:YugN family protein [Paenibacillus xerothermodurans]|nr:YugN family protein [Paenibacillus xerothermodurans]
MHTFGAMIDQFSAPANKDAHVEEKWVERARE